MAAAPWTRWLRLPVLHFLVAGGVLFVVVRWFDTGASRTSSSPRGIVITAAEVTALRETFRQETGRAPTAEDEAALVEHTVEEEVLYREALARGLDRGDRSVQHRIVEKMRALAHDPAADPAALYHDACALGLDRDDAIVRRILIEKMRLLSSMSADAIDDTDLRSFFDAHAERYRSPARVTLWHVFLAAPKHGAFLDRDAAATLAGLRRDGIAPEDAARRGDPFPLGQRFAASAERDLSRSFGPDFAHAALDLPVGAWSGPLPSPFGRHLIWVVAREPGTIPPLAAVRGRVLEDYRAERRDDRLRDATTQLRARYDVRVERGDS